MQIFIDKNVEERMMLIAGIINSKERKAVVSVESLAKDMLRHGIGDFFRGHVELINKSEPLPK